MFRMDMLPRFPGIKVAVSSETSVRIYRITWPEQQNLIFVAVTNPNFKMVYSRTSETGVSRNPRVPQMGVRGYERRKCVMAEEFYLRS